MFLGVPQIIYLSLILLSLGIVISKHGEPQGNYNFWSTLISAIIQIIILKVGGFFG